MRLKTYRWYDILLGLSTFLFPFWQLAVSWATDKQQAANQSKTQLDLLPQLVLALKYWVPFVLALVYALVYLIKLAKEAAPKRALRSYLNYLHEAYFPHASSGPDPEYRITLFIPTIWARKWKYLRYPSFDKYLTVYVRSGGLHPKSKVLWNISKSEQGRFDGVAGYAYATGVFVDVSNLPDYNHASDEEKQTYLRKTFVTEERVRMLNVLSRAYQALVIQNRSGQKLGVLMMESRIPDGLRAISSQRWQEIAETIQCLVLS
jgi:hypothetical protein